MVSCPHCNYNLDGILYEDPYFVPVDGGPTYNPYEPSDYWVEGIQTCPECNYTFEVSG